MCIDAPNARERVRGFSLLELVLFIVIVSVAVTGLLSVMNLSAAHSADPLLRKQALSVAEALLEEIEMVPSFGDVTAYNGYPSEGLATRVVVPSGYTVAVVVVKDNEFLSLLSSEPDKAWRVTITVAYAGGSVVVEGYRTNYSLPP
jgi:MSHA pilin protein MshD